MYLRARCFTGPKQAVWQTCSLTAVGKPIGAPHLLLYTDLWPDSETTDSVCAVYCLLQDTNLGKLLREGGKTLLQRKRIAVR